MNTLTISNKEVKVHAKKELLDIYPDKKKAVAAIFDNNGKNNLSNAYDGVIDKLAKLMGEEFLKMEEKNLEKLKHKYKITKICALYDLMKINFDLFPIYDEVFLFSSEARKAMVTSGCIFYHYKDTSSDTRSLKFIPLDKIVIDDHTVNISDNELEKLNEKEKVTTGELKFLIKKNKTAAESIQFWQGCGMELPKVCTVNIGFNTMFPKLYIRQKDEPANEIVLEEQSWNATLMYQDGFLEVPEDKENYKITDETLPEYAENLKLMRTCSIKGKSFEKVDLRVNEDSSNCDIIISLPYVPVKSDALTRVAFNCDTAEVILTTT